ncbi:MAG: polynucleotide adenylyltransferase, partial [Treponema sp.]|nr:polynucleotide adenylyltransferase [Treponema sp.]
MNSIAIPTELKKVNEIFRQNGFKAYLVGGAVRDIIRKKDGHDWDLATDATPQQVMKIFRRVIPTGIAHGTVTIHILGKEIETTTFRTEGRYTDGRHPDKVEYAKTIEEDLSRRDLTINAIAADLEDGHLVDPFGGREDIKNKIIRTVGS